MFRNMVTSLFKYERIRTTDAKAKELKRWADQMITLAKRGDLHARRQALSIIRERKIVSKLFDDIADRFGGLSGGYTRVVKLGRRPGDAAPVSMVELVSGQTSPRKKAEKPKVEAAPQPVVQPELQVTSVEKEAVEGEETSETAAEEETKPEAQAEAAPVAPDEISPPEEEGKDVQEPKGVEQKKDES
jgi:large subunit ribosomal protein L17